MPWLQGLTICTKLSLPLSWSELSVVSTCFSSPASRRRRRDGSTGPNVGSSGSLVVRVAPDGIGFWVVVAVPGDDVRGVAGVEAVDGGVLVVVSKEASDTLVGVHCISEPSWCFIC